jgi:hypothetical protein
MEGPRRVQAREILGTRDISETEPAHGTIWLWDEVRLN